MRCLNYEWSMALTIVFLAALPPLAAVSQQSSANKREKSEACLNITVPHANFAARYRAIRVIEDFETRQRWLLLQDMEHPAAPARLLAAASELSCAGLHIKGSGSQPQVNIQNVLLPVIHAGDSLVLSEHTRVSDAELEAVALRPAAIGESLSVRLKFGGATLSAIATGPGRATVSKERSEAHR